MAASPSADLCVNWLRESPFPGAICRTLVAAALAGRSPSGLLGRSLALSPPERVTQVLVAQAESRCILALRSPEGGNPMTLIVTLRIPDGIVIAGDSLSTSMAQVKVQGQLGIKCPECGHEHTVGPMDVAQVSMPSTTFSFAQKVFPFMGNFGIGTFGHSLLLGKTMHFALRELEKLLIADGEKVDGVQQVSDRIGPYVHDMVVKQITDLENAPDDWLAVGFCIVGYDGSDAKTNVLSVGKEIRTKSFTGAGCTRSGWPHVVDAIWQLYKQRPEDQAAYESFSLQDAIDYAKFLIVTTSSYQQFSRTIPSVGGKIDIALVTPFDGFKWIEQKPLAKIIGGSQ